MKILNLMWTDVKDNKYHLGNLYKINNKYYFEIIEKGLSNALRHGCFGIGTLDITKIRNESNELFDFFKKRIPKISELTDEELMNLYGLNEYDDMKILEITGGRSIFDRYYLE